MFFCEGLEDKTEQAGNKIIAERNSKKNNHYFQRGKKVGEKSRRLSQIISQLAKKSDGCLDI